MAGAGEHHHRQARATHAQRVDQLRTVRAGTRHRQVGQDCIAVVAVHQVQQLGAVTRTADDVHQVGLQHDGDAMQDHGMVVGNDDAWTHAVPRRSKRPRRAAANA